MQNRLVSATNLATHTVTSFVYDGEGQRIQQVEPDGKVTVYLGP